MRYICKKLIMAKAHNHSDRRVGKSKPSKLKAPETTYSKKKTTPSKPKGKANANPDEIRLNKYISNSGMCSRREADMHISIGSAERSSYPGPRTWWCPRACACVCLGGAGQNCHHF